jgi:hypothetical protein
LLLLSIGILTYLTTPEHVQIIVPNINTLNPLHNCKNKTPKWAHIYEIDGMSAANRKTQQSYYSYEFNKYTLTM